MFKLTPTFLKYLESQEIDLFKLDENERKNKYSEFKTFKKLERKTKVDNYNKLYYQKNKDIYFKDYYKSNFDSIAEKSKIRYKNKTSKPTDTESEAKEE